MIFKHTLRTAIFSVKSHKSRSALTILGIVIGITAIILIISVGRGAERLILNQVQGLGGETIIIEPGREPKGPSDFIEVFTDSLKERDIEALKLPANVRGIKGVEPVIFRAATVIFKNETKRVTVRGGGSELLLKMYNLYPREGVFYSEDDIKQSASVTVLGSDVKEELFGSLEAVGEKIKIGGRMFRVVGVLAQKGQIAFLDIDKVVMIPYTTAQKYLTGTKFYNAILVWAEGESVVPQVARDVKLTLRELHDITDPEKDDFHVMTQADVVNRIGVISTILSMLLISIASISLVVGGIGIMNIMLVSVTERTKEIGLRKALGATKKNILTQFLLESVILTLVGGIIGIILGALLSFATAFILSRFAGLDWGFAFPISAAVIGFSVAAAVGLIFGIYPARQASKKSPIEALRYE